MMDRTFQELNTTIVDLRRSIVKLDATIDQLDRRFVRVETTIEHLDDRVDARLWKHTWVVLGGVAAMVGATAAVVALLS